MLKLLSKIKIFLSSLSKNVKTIAAVITVGSTVFYFYNNYKNLIEKNQKLKKQSIEKQMTLWVKNNTDSPRHFHYRDKLENNGGGEPIPAGMIKSYYFKKGIYDWYYYDSRNGFTEIDTINKGELLFKYYQQKELIVIDQ